MPDGTGLALPADEARLGLVRGTHILTESGDCRVEQLRPGDSLVDPTGGSSRLVAVQREVIRGGGGGAPIRLAYGAFGNHSELLVAPGQPVSIGGKLVPAHLLVDGVRAAVAYGGMVAYYSLFTDREALISVEGAPLGCLAAEPALTLPTAEAAGFGAALRLT